MKLSFCNCMYSVIKYFWERAVSITFLNVRFLNRFYFTIINVKCKK